MPSATTIGEVLSQIAASVAHLEIEDIKQLLDPLRNGMRVTSPVFDAGTFLYRGRRLDGNFNKESCLTVADLTYPPPQCAQLGRLNRIGDPKFYASMSKEVVFFELPGLKAGDELVLSFWKTNERMYVNNIGYTDFVFQKLGATRPRPRWEAVRHEGRQTFDLPQDTRRDLMKALSEEENDNLRAAFSKYFMDVVQPEHSYKYKITAAIGELHLGKLNDGGQFAGVLYPSLRMTANGDNVALLPWFVDNRLEFRKAVHVRIDSRSDNSFTITTLDCARSVSEKGHLRWQGGAAIWSGSVEAGETLTFKFKPGRDEDGDYLISAQGNPGFWALEERLVCRADEHAAGEFG